MFSILRERKAVAVLAGLASSTPLSVASASPAERAAALILCNIILILGAKEWGRAALEAPSRLDKGLSSDLVCLMAERRVALVAAASQLDGRYRDDPAVSAYRWELLANEIVTLTVGSGLSPAAAKAMVTCWKSLWVSRRACDEAIKSMSRYAKAYTVEPTPRIDGKRPSEEYLRRLGSTLPPMFRPKGGAKGGKAAAKAPSSRQGGAKSKSVR